MDDPSECQHPAVMAHELASLELTSLPYAEEMDFPRLAEWSLFKREKLWQAAKRQLNSRLTDLAETIILSIEDACDAGTCKARGAEYFNACDAVKFDYLNKFSKRLANQPWCNEHEVYTGILDRLEKLLPPKLRVDDSVREEKGLRVWFYSNSSSREPEHNKIEWTFTWQTAYKEASEKRKARGCEFAPAHETTFEEVAAAFKDDTVKNLVAPDAGHCIELSLRSLKAIKDLLDGETYSLLDMPAQDVETINEYFARIPNADLLDSETYALSNDAKRIKIKP